MKKPNALLLAVLVLVLSPGLLRAAETVYDSVVELFDAPVYMTAALSSGDSSSYATPLRPRKTYGNSKVVVVPTFSQAGASAMIEVIGFQRRGTATSEGTLILSTLVTASLTCTSDGTRYVASDGYFVSPTLGFQIYDVRLRAMNGGDVKWKAFSLGHESQISGTTNQ